MSRTAPPFKVSSLDDLAGGGLVLVPAPRGLSRDGGPAWLGRGYIGSDKIVRIGLLAEPFATNTWIGEGGSACMRAIMITCARRGIPAVMVPYDPAGWRKEVEPLCMTFGYQANLDRTNVNSRWRDDPVTRRIRIVDQESWELWQKSVEVPMVDGPERRAALLSFIENPMLTGPAFGVREVK